MQNSEENNQSEPKAKSVPTKNPQNIHESIRITTDYLVEVKAQVNADIKRLCNGIDNMYKVTSELSRDIRRLEMETESLPEMEGWIVTTASEISHLKSQIRFLHNILDSE